MSSIGVTEIIVLFVLILGTYYLTYKMGKNKGKIEEKERQEKKITNKI